MGAAPVITEQDYIDSGAILTREDARILSRLTKTQRMHIRYSDAIDGQLMALAEAKAELKREVKRIVNDNGDTQ